MNELAHLSDVQRALAEVETVEDAKGLYDKLETLSQYARRYRLDHDKQNEIAEAKLRTARKGGTLLVQTARAGNPQLSRDETIGRLPEGVSRSLSSRWQKLAGVGDAEFEGHIAAVKGSDEELTFAGALRFQRLGVHFSSETGEWGTPQELFDGLDAEFGFGLDVCASDANAKCLRYFDVETDGLAQRWEGVCWMNPPYGEIRHWVKKAYESGQAGATVVCLVPARVDTGWWWDYCRFGEIRFLRGRLKFGGGETGAPFPSAVVVFGPGREPNALSAHWERAA